MDIYNNNPQKLNKNMGRLKLRTCAWILLSGPCLKVINISFAVLHLCRFRPRSRSYESEWRDVQDVL